MMNFRTAVIVLIVMLLVAALFLFGPTYTSRERYGPPPGMARALTLEELGDRGWAQAEKDYIGDTASSLSHYVMRSA